LLEQAAGERQQPPDVVARGELRHHAAVVGVQPRLRMQDVPEEPPAVVIERDSGLIAGGFDAEHQHDGQNGFKNPLWLDIIQVFQFALGKI